MPYPQLWQVAAFFFMSSLSLIWKDCSVQVSFHLSWLCLTGSSALNYWEFYPHHFFPYYFSLFPEINWFISFFLCILADWDFLFLSVKLCFQKKNIYIYIYIYMSVYIYIYIYIYIYNWRIVDSLDSYSKESACNARDLGLIPGSWKSPGEGNGYPLQYFCLKNSMDRGAWRATAHGVAKS